MNTAFVFSPVLARTVPYSTFGAGVAVVNDSGPPTLFVGVYDALDTATVSGFRTFFQNGAVIDGLATLPVAPFGLPGHHSLGGAYSTRSYDSLQDLPYYVTKRLAGLVPQRPSRAGSWAVYYQFDQAVWADAADPRRAWGVFGSAGLSDGDPNPIRYAAYVGLGGAVPWRGRAGDTFGVGYFYLGMSEAFKNIAPQVVPLRDEHGVELFYNLAVTPWCRITPDFQVVTPVRAGVEAATVFGVRAKIDF
jgi:porin